MRKGQQILFFSLLFFYFIGECLSQDSLSVKSTRSIFDDPYAFKDSVYTQQFSYTDIFFHKKLDDTSFHISDIWYNPTQSTEFLYGDLGHIGSAHLKDYYKPDESIGIRYSFPQYDLYKIASSVPEYRINTAFTDLGFNQSTDQSQQAIQADFAAKYNNGILDIGYSRIKDQGAYLSQLNIHTAFYTKVSIQLKPVLLQFQISSNIIQAQDNGGFRTDSLFPPPFSTFRSDVPIRLNESAQTRHQEKYYIVRDYWPVSGRLSDSSFLVLKHQIQYNNAYVRFYDTKPNETYYPVDIFDSRGLRYFIGDNQLENSFHVLWRTRQLTWLQGQLNAGVLHKWHFMEQYFDKSQAQWLAIDGRLQTTVANILFLDSKLTQSLVPDLQDTRFLNELNIGWRKYFNLQGNVDFIRRRAALNEETFYLNGRPLWSSSLKPETTFRIGGSIEATPYQSSVGVDYTRVNNLIYYTSDWERKQADTGIDLLRLYAKTRLKIKAFHLDSETSLQLTQNALLPYARIVSDIRTYFQFHLFKKKMTVTTGPYGKFYTQPHNYTYSPALGQFILTDSRVRSAAYQLNYILAFRVSSMTIYGHLTGIQSFWNNWAFYEVQDYAYPVMGLRFGVSWKLYN